MIQKIGLGWSLEAWFVSIHFDSSQLDATNQLQMVPFYCFGVNLELQGTKWFQLVAVLKLIFEDFRMLRIVLSIKQTWSKKIHRNDPI